MAGGYLPKSTAITDHQPHLDSIEDELDDQPRAVLGIRTPSEVFSKLLADSGAATTWQHRPATAAASSPFGRCAERIALTPLER